MAQKRWQAIARGLGSYGWLCQPSTSLGGGSLNGDYTGIEAINTVWSKFTLRLL